jgi:hypothetical protein
MRIMYLTKKKCYGLASLTQLIGHYSIYVVIKVRALIILLIGGSGIFVGGGYKILM